MNILGLFLKADFLVQLIILILIGFSIVSWAIILQQTKSLNIATKKMEAFENYFWSGTELSDLYKECQIRRDTLTGLEQIFYSGFKEFSRLRLIYFDRSESVVKGTSRIMRISMNHELELLEAYIPFLAIAGSVSPYIGLFGTILGIMNSFVFLGSVKQVTLQMVAPGIAEALISTAIGLFAAIPSVIAYNRLNLRLNKLEQDYDNFIEEFLAILYRINFVSDKQ